MATNTERVEIPIAGMTCGHCVQAVTRALEAVPGVRSAAVDLAMGRAMVEVEPGRKDRQTLNQAVEGAGYSVPEGPAVPNGPNLVTIGLPPAPKASNSEEWSLAIGGMHCASCVSRVEGALAAVEGVREARVSLATERASVVVDPLKVNESALSRAAQTAGYSARRAEITTGEGAESLRRERDERVAYWRNRLIVGVVLTLPMIVIGYLPVGPWLGLKTTTGWLMFPLATALQVYLGSPYLVGAWGRLKQGSSNMDTLIALGTLTAYGYSLYQLVGEGGRGTSLDLEGKALFAAIMTALIAGPIAWDEFQARSRPRAA